MTSPRPATSRPITRRRWPSCVVVLGGGREVPRAAAARRIGVLLRDRAAARRANHVHVSRPVQNVASGMIPRIYNHSYAISADLEIPPGGAEGVIVAEADHLGGF